jgi:prolyl 4-hydroxylase
MFTMALPEPPSPTAQRLLAHPLTSPLCKGRAEIFSAPAFLLPAACNALISSIDANRQPSTVADYNGDNEFRTSETGNLDPAERVVDIVRYSIATLLGLPLAHAEPLQGQRYSRGQEFKLHCDWFRTDSADYARYCTLGGQRTWTAMAYLNDVDAGGETHFPHLDLSITPRAGMLIAWNNLRSDGSGNPRTRHHEQPVGAGVKHIITLWFRERAYLAA